MRRLRHILSGMLLFFMLFPVGCQFFPTPLPAVFQDSMQPANRETEHVYRTFEEAVAASSHVLTGKFIEYLPRDGYTELKFGGKAHLCVRNTRKCHCH